MYLYKNICIVFKKDIIKYVGALLEKNCIKLPKLIILNLQIISNNETM